MELGAAKDDKGAVVVGRREAREGRRGEGIDMPRLPTRWRHGVDLRQSRTREADTLTAGHRQIWVDELEVKAKSAGKAKMEFHYFDDADHSLNLGGYFAAGKALPAGRRVERRVRLHTAYGRNTRSLPRRQSPDVHRNASRD